MKRIWVRFVSFSFNFMVRCVFFYIKELLEIFLVKRLYLDKYSEKISVGKIVWVGVVYVVSVFIIC